MRLLLLTISLMISLSYSEQCEFATPDLPTVTECEKLFDDNGCQCSCESMDDRNCDNQTEGCDITMCPTTTTDSPMATTTTDAPITTTDIPMTTATTECICPTYSPPTITSAPSSKSKGSKGGGGVGIGECDCKGGIVELRYVYLGDTSNVQIDLYTGKDRDELVCSYSNIQPNEEIICNLYGDADGLITQGLDKFSTESPFVITYPNGETCQAQYHTSCSQDIVGVVQDECNQLIVSGWKDGENYNNGGDCDDGIIPCICDETIQTTATGNIPQTTAEDICYCESDFGTSMPTTIAPKSKGGKSKGGKSKGSKSGSDGLGVGDCDCNGGQIDLRLMYIKNDDKQVNIKCFHKDGEELNKFKGIQFGEEVTCSVENTQFEKFGTETIVQIFDKNDNQICETSIHTSCSRDIVGTYGDGNCNEYIIVTGWRDIGNGLNNEDGCDDGFEECPCSTGQPWPFMNSQNEQNAPAVINNKKENTGFGIIGYNSYTLWYLIGAAVILIVCFIGGIYYYCNHDSKKYKVVSAGNKLQMSVQNSVDMMDIDGDKETEMGRLSVTTMKV